MSSEVNKERAIRAIVGSSVEAYASAFSDRHLTEVDDEDGTINMKTHNVFIAALGREIQYYSNSEYSFRNSLNKLFQSLAFTLEDLFYDGIRHTHILTTDKLVQTECVNYWNTICNDKHGYEIMLDELNRHLPLRFL